MRIYGVRYDFAQSDGNGTGPSWEEYFVGEACVVEINYHQPQGDGDRHYCDVSFSDGHKERVFNLNNLYYKD